MPGQREAGTTILERELVRSVRGALSQDQLSRRLGFSFNQVYQWEAGRTRISWADFARLARARKADLAPPLRDRLGYVGDLGDGAALARHLIGDLSAPEAARRIGVSAYVIRSWRTGRTQVLLGSILALLQRLQNFLPEFVGAIADVALIPSLRRELERRERQRRFFFDFPLGSAALHCLDLTELKAKPAYPDGFLARKLAVGLPEERAMLAEMLSSGVICRVGRHFKVLCRDLETSGDFADALRTRRFWLERLLKMMETLRERPEFTVFALTSYDVSKAGHARVKQAHFEFLTKVYEILASDLDPKERVIIQLFQMLDLEESSPRPPDRCRG